MKKFSNVKSVQNETYEQFEFEISSIRRRNQEITGIINLLHCFLSEQGQ